MHPSRGLSELIRAFLVGATVVTAACGSSPTAPQVPSPTYTVTGTVTESTSEGVVPVQGALITHQTSGISTTTDAAGTYSLVRVPPGMATVTVTRDSFETAIRLVSVFSNTRFDLQLVRRRELPSTHSLSGMVFERVGSVQAPVAGAVVEDSYSHLSAVTGADGRYRIDFSPADLGRSDGFADVFVRRAGFETVNRSFVIFGEIQADFEVTRR